MLAKATAAHPETPKKAKEAEASIRKREGSFAVQRCNTIKAEREAGAKAKAKATAADPETPKKAKKAEASSKEAEQETEETENNYKEDGNISRGPYNLMYVCIYMYICIYIYKHVQTYV